jgi:hypothetical protein
MQFNDLELLERGEELLQHRSVGQNPRLKYWVNIPDSPPKLPYQFSRLITRHRTE